MKFLKKKRKNRDEDDDDDFVLDDDDDDEDEEDSEEKGGVNVGGFLGKMLGKLKRGGDDDDLDEYGDDVDDDDDDDDDGNDDEVDDESSEGERESPVQMVKLEGVADVRPVGDSADSLAPGGKSGSGKGNKGASKSTKSSKSKSNPAPEQKAEPVASSGAAQEDSDNKDSAKEGKSEGGGVDISLMDAFEEVAEVDERLKYLADGVDDVGAQDLAVELREFLAELEK